MLLHAITPRYSKLLHDTPLCSTLLHATLRYSTLNHATPLYSTLLLATPRYSTLLHATPRHSKLVYGNANDYDDNGRIWYNVLIWTRIFNLIYILYYNRIQ